MKNDPGPITIMAIDPGPEHSAYVVTERVWEGLRITASDIVPNATMALAVKSFACLHDNPHLVIEQIASMGMAVGSEVFETCVATGRFMQAFESEAPEFKAHRIPRMPIKVHLCGTAKAKDANVRQALIDRFGGSAAIRKAKKATKKEPAVEAGPLAGISSHLWSALAVAVVYNDKHRIGVL